MTVGSSFPTVITLKAFYLRCSLELTDTADQGEFGFALSVCMGKKGVSVPRLFLF